MTTREFKAADVSMTTYTNKKGRVRWMGRFSEDFLNAVAVGNDEAINALVEAVTEAVEAEYESN